MIFNARRTPLCFISRAASFALLGVIGIASDLSALNLVLLLLELLLIQEVAVEVVFFFAHIILLNSKNAHSIFLRNILNRVIGFGMVPHGIDGLYDLVDSFDDFRQRG